MNRNHVNGASRHLKGRVQTTFGGLTGSTPRQARGATNQLMGGVEYVYGDVREQTGRFINNAHDLAEDAFETAAEGLHQGRKAARRLAKRGEVYGREALGYVDNHRLLVFAGIAVIALAASFLSSRSR